MDTERTEKPPSPRCNDKAPMLLGGGPANWCVLPAGHDGPHEAETEGNGVPPMRWWPSDEPARCPHEQTGPHSVHEFVGTGWDNIEHCPGPAASGTPEATE